MQLKGNLNHEDNNRFNIYDGYINANTALLNGDYLMERHVHIDQLKARIEYYKSLGYKEKAKTLKLILKEKLNEFKARVK